MDTELTQQEIDVIRQATERRQNLISATELIYTAKYLKLQGGQPDYIRYDRFPNTINKFRKAGFAMNPYEKVSKMRSGEIICYGPQSVVPSEGNEINVRKYYSEWEIDYKLYAENQKILTN
ncbi:hypothetical protein SAMD00019534_126080 [Acytostelium subglobosum LB1]|uniref:hypothetical protein n=1 Tax=Acytostelium subglobosum LB1 TaxID=1410327 RepID=UPI0006451E37|nr:hypothetical protein SAMD00019534_126080 [Acytostelium subglobosum LB1]GAM29432.1 hypothetical protein SAMD00019534_126080 [Acytostelium subglobosum LB1]|eukprot:XP_012747623.1 hypothetical protein SAMD00019534_126080 [Acytostelium subglobosum LB1]